jgi:hypothetical protein
MINPDFYTTQHIELEVAELDIDEGLKDCILATLERYEQLKAKLDEIDKQEPAFYAAKDEIEAIGSSCNSCLLFKSKDEPNFTIPFYASPVQQSPAISKMETNSTENINAIKVLRENVRNKDNGVLYGGIHDNDLTRNAIEFLISSIDDKQGA